MHRIFFCSSWFFRNPKYWSTFSSHPDHPSQQGSVYGASVTRSKARYASSACPPYSNVNSEMHVASPKYSSIEHFLPLGGGLRHGSLSTTRKSNSSTKELLQVQRISIPFESTSHVPQKIFDSDDVCDGPLPVPNTAVDSPGFRVGMHSGKCATVKTMQDKHRHNQTVYLKFAISVLCFDRKYSFRQNQPSIHKMEDDLDMSI